MRTGILKVRYTRFWYCLYELDSAESKRKADNRAQFRQRKIYTLQILWRNLIKIEAFDNLLFKKDLRYGRRPILLKKYPKLEQSLVERELEILAHMHDAAKARDVDFYVFIVPFKVQCLKANLLDNENVWFLPEECQLK